MRHHLGLQPPDIAGMNYIGTRRRDPDIARNVYHRVPVELAPMRVIQNRATPVLKGDQRLDIEPVVVGDCSLRNR